MWEIFGALFGGIYCGTKIANDKAKSKVADRQIAQIRISGEEWNKSVRDEELNSRLRTMVETEQGLQELKERAESVIRSLPGMDYADIHGSMSEAAKHTVVFIETVKHGKLSPLHEWHLFEKYLWLCADLEFSKKAKIAFLCWIEDTLQANGCDAHLYFDERSLPEFTWEPHLISYEKATSIRADNIEDIIPGDSTAMTAIRNAPKIKAKQQKERYSRWKAAVDGGEMQAFLELKFDENHWVDVRQSTLVFLCTLPGLENADYWLTNTSFRNSCRNLIFLIEMVKRGKLPWFCYDGIPDHLIRDTIDLYIPRAVKIAFAQWVENTLKAQGVSDAEMYYRDKFNPEFVFASTLLDLDKATRITDPNLPSLMKGESEELIAARNKPLIQKKKTTYDEQG